jgi:predicted transcriptional regulator
MKKKPVPKPTDAELAILRVLWERGPSTVRQVYDVLSEQRDFAYTTTLKLLQLMTEKGITVREEEGRVHLYRAGFAQEDTQQRLVADLLDRAFGGSSAKLVVQALAAKPASPEELREIRQLLAEYKEKDRG